MRNEPQRTGSIATVVAGRMKSQSHASDVAAIAVSICQELQDALGPIVGDRGVKALYARASHLTSLSHTWFGTGQPDLGAELIPASWQEVLTGRPTQEALTCACDFFQAFQDLLGSLIGTSLTERLLEPIWISSPNESNSEDTAES